MVQPKLRYDYVTRFKNRRDLALIRELGRRRLIYLGLGIDLVDNRPRDEAHTRIGERLTGNGGQYRKPLGYGLLQLGHEQTKGLGRGDVLQGGGLTRTHAEHPSNAADALAEVVVDVINLLHGDARVRVGDDAHAAVVRAG